MVENKMEQCVLSEFELNVIYDIKRNHGENLQMILEADYGNGNHYDNDWILKNVFYPICNKILTEAETFCLMESMIDIISSCHINTLALSRIYEVIYINLKFIPLERLV